MTSCAYVKLELMLHVVMASTVAMRYTLHVKNIPLSEFWLSLPCSASSMDEYGLCILRAVCAQVRLLFSKDTAPTLTRMLFVSPSLLHACGIAIAGMCAVVVALRYSQSLL